MRNEIVDSQEAHQALTPEQHAGFLAALPRMKRRNEGADAGLHRGLVWDQQMKAHRVRGE
mgnify:CR=1 FL=1